MEHPRLENNKAVWFCRYEVELHLKQCMFILALDVTFSSVGRGLFVIIIESRCNSTNHGHRDPFKSHEEDAVG